jgi:putative heme transporter
VENGTASQPTAVRPADVSGACKDGVEPQVDEGTLMGLFARTAKTAETASTAEPAGSAEAARAAEIQQAEATTRGLWADGLGRAGARAAQVLLVVALVFISVYALLQVQLVVLPLLIALIIAAAMAPLIRLLRRSMSSTLAAWVAFLGVGAVLGGVVTGIVFAVRSEWGELATSATEGFGQLQSFLENGPIPIDQQQINEAVDAVVNFVTSSQFRAGALSGLSAASQFLTGLVLLAVVLFYFLKDGDRIWSFFLSWVSPRNKPRWRRSGTRTVEVLGGYMRGTATVAAVDAVAIGTALLVLQVPLALPLAVVVFITGFIPMVGATVAGILAALVALVANGPVIALIVVAVVVVVNQLEGNFLQPVLMGRSLSLHGLVILLALTAGTVLGGIVGAILAVPFTAVAWAIVQVWTGREMPEEERSGRLPEAAQAEAAQADAAGAEAG